ncbi:hypothetical protein ACPW96_22830 [Micromonospora sp. DT81.3]|uniref:hypothetical protein n=1 Tax=Micromonospora sp. DT81.3 TaxID=3416523 RepID=UPI003CF9674B
MANAPELVGYAYIAEKLNVTPQTVRVYATGTAQKKAGFPENVAPETSRSPLFLRSEADAFIERRIAESKTPARLNANRPDTAPASKPAKDRSEISANARANAQAKRAATKG